MVVIVIVYVALSLTACSNSQLSVLHLGLKCAAVEAFFDRSASWPAKDSKHLLTLPLTIQNSSAALTLIAGPCAAHLYSLL